MLSLLSWWVAVVLVAGAAVALLVGARKLDPNEVVIGTWDVSLRCAGSILDAELFPPRVTTSTLQHSPTAVASPAPPYLPPPSPPSKQQQTQSRWPILGRYQRVDCQLTIFPNHTFWLCPIGGPRFNSVTTSSSVPAAAAARKDPAATTAEASAAVVAAESILPIRGQWVLRPNPYCVTDRFYDDLLLTSYPRVKKQFAWPVFSSQVVGGNLFQQHQHNDTSPDISYLERSVIRLSCRVQGHFSAIRRFPRYPGWYARGRLSHGVITVQPQPPGPPPRERSEVNEKRNPCSVRASFVGKRLISARSLTSWYDNDESE